MPVVEEAEDSGGRAVPALVARAASEGGQRARISEKFVQRLTKHSSFLYHPRNSFEALNLQSLGGKSPQRSLSVLAAAGGSEAALLWVLCCSYTAQHCRCWNTAPAHLMC